MPLFYFHQWCGDDYNEDRQGCAFADLDAARLGAIAGARGLLVEDVRHGRFDLNQRFELHDAAGMHRLTVLFEDVVETVWPARRNSRGLAEAGG